MHTAQRVQQHSSSMIVLRACILVHEPEQISHVPDASFSCLLCPLRGIRCSAATSPELGSRPCSSHQHSPCQWRVRTGASLRGGRLQHTRFFSRHGRRGVRPRCDRTRRNRGANKAAGQASAAAAAVPYGRGSCSYGHEHSS